MKKIASIMTFILVIQCSTSTFAQSSSIEQTKHLEKCMNDKFEFIKKQLDQETAKKKGTADTDEMTSTIRLYFSKTMMELFLFAFDKGVRKSTRSAGWTTLTSVASAYLTYKMYVRQKNIASKLVDVEAKYKVTKLSAVELEAAGGEEFMDAQIELLKNMKSNAKFFKYGFLTVFLAAGYFTYLIFDKVLENANNYDLAYATLEHLFNSKTEAEFYEYLASNEKLITDFRNYSVEFCNEMTEQDVIEILFKATKKQVDESMNEAQKQIDTLTIKNH